MENNNEGMFQKIRDMLSNMRSNPECVTDEDRDLLVGLYHSLCSTMGISEHSRWEVKWRVEKWFDSAKKLAGFEPDEICTETQNIILDSGAKEMLRLIAGLSNKPFSNANAKMFVGTNTTAEAASQSGILAAGSQRAYADQDDDYPVVSGRQIIYRGTFGEDEANFAWNEVAIANGTGSDAVFMNRKRATGLGTKTSGTWTIQITITLASA